MFLLLQLSDGYCRAAVVNRSGSVLAAAVVVSACCTVRLYEYAFVDFVVATRTDRS